MPVLVMICGSTTSSTATANAPRCDVANSHHLSSKVVVLTSVMTSAIKHVPTVTKLGRRAKCCVHQHIQLVILLITGRRLIVFRLDTGHSHYTLTTLDIVKHLPVTTLQLFRLKMDGTLAPMKDTKA